MIRTRQLLEASDLNLLLLVTLVCALSALSPEVVWAQRGASGPPEHADVEPVNYLPNPYETVRNWGTLPDGRNWGSVRDQLVCWF